MCLTLPGSASPGKPALGTARGMEATPIVIGGVLYVSGVAGRVYARDAATGKEIWTFEPEIDPLAQRGVCCDNVNRGIAIQGGRLFVAALDAKLYALDLQTGKVLWVVDTVEDRTRGINSTGAPEVAGDVVLIGNSGAEYDVRGYVSAYDLKTGKLAWRFHTVPRDPKLGPQDHPRSRSGSEDLGSEQPLGHRRRRTPWDAINYDPETGLVLVGTGNGGPYHAAKRSPNGGDNLYLSSIVALDTNTGRVKWHYQETPGDNWDFTATAPILLTKMKVDGETRPVLIHAPKNGFLYVIDRRDGKLLRASKLVYTNWASGIDLKTGRPQFTPEESDYSKGPRIIFPATPGAHNWTKMALSPETGLLYVSVLDMSNLIFMTPGDKPRVSRALNNDASLIFGPDIAPALPTLPPPIAAEVAKLPAFEHVKANPPISELRAVDPLTGKTVWAQPNAGWQDHSGVLATASGLVFSGNLAGQLRAYDARTGKLLASIETGSTILAAPMTYKIGGVNMSPSPPAGAAAAGLTRRAMPPPTIAPTPTASSSSRSAAAPCRSPRNCRRCKPRRKPRRSSPAPRRSASRRAATCSSAIARSATPTSTARSRPICAASRPKPTKPSTRSCCAASTRAMACPPGATSSPSKTPTPSTPT